MLWEQEINRLVRKNFTNSITLCGGYDKERAEAAIDSGLVNLTAFGRLSINNPDLVERRSNNWPSSKIHTWIYLITQEIKVTDYPMHQQQSIPAWQILLQTALAFFIGNTHCLCGIDCNS